MRKIALAACMCLVTCISTAQHVNVDSLQKLVAKTTDPAKKYDLLSQIIGQYYINGHGDFTSENSLDMVKSALQLNDNKKIAASYNELGDYYAYNKGDNTTALDYFFKAIPYAEKVPNGRELASIYTDIGVAYAVLGNYAEAYRFTQKAEASLPTPSNPDYWYLKLQIQINFGAYYALNKDPAKLIVHIRIAEQINARLKYPTWDLLINILYGAYYAQSGKTDSATQAFSRAVALDKNNRFVFAHYNLDFYYIPFLIGNKEFTEAYRQANKMMQMAVADDDNDIKLKSADYLREIYEKEGKSDSAYYFAKEALALKDTVLQQTILNKERALNFNEQVRKDEEAAQRKQEIQTVVVFSIIAVIAIIALLLYRNSLQRKKANYLLSEQKEEIAAQRDNLSHALDELKTTQTQLIQREKMASLGELTAGIAHEIQNPLNFVNNFSEVNREMVDELEEELKKGNIEEALAIVADIKGNEEKINHHGKRADFIVKGMLLHSRNTTGEKQLTNINILADEFLKLSYHGLRAKDKTFNAELITNFDEQLPKVNIAAQDIGRVLLNLFNNAFYAVNQKQKTAGASYKPEVTISTSAEKNNLVIKVKDNGNGIPDAIKEKIMQPFFTTKPTGEGTGLGLSLSYDIVVKGHGGSIQVNSVEDEGSEFIIQLPLS